MSEEINEQKVEQKPEWWFICAEWIEMPPAIALASATAHPPRLMKDNSIIAEHPALHACRMLPHRLNFTITMAIPCPPDVVERVGQFMAEMQRLQTENGR